MSQKQSRPSLLGALLWLGLGILFLLHNFGVGPDFWSTAGRYWPLLLILLGLGKVADYFLKKDSVSVSVGEIIGILFLLVIGSALTKISDSHFVQVIRELPIRIGGASVKPGQWIGESHAFNEETAAALDRSLPIVIENAYGSVSVIPGSDREVRVRMKKVVYANEMRAKEIAGEIRVEAKAEKRGESSTALKPEAEPGNKSHTEYLVVRTNRDALTSKNYMYNTDLEVTVPKNSKVRIHNTFGDVRVTGLNGKLELYATHRALEIRDCTGEFNISAGYAESRLINLVGNIDLDSRSRGGVYIENIKGDIVVSNHYSPLEVFDVDGKVQITNTEGNIRVERIAGPVVIDSRGSQVQVHDLQNSLKITASHKNVEISDVASDVDVESRYAGVSLKQIKGNVSIRSNSDRISADDVQGSLKLTGYGSGVIAHGIEGPLDIQTTLKEVVVNDYAGSCSITSEYAGISVSSRRPIKGDIRLKNQNGDIDLFLPENASFVIEATARNGRVDSEYSGLGLGRNGKVGVLKSKVKNGGPRVFVETSNGNIRIHPAQGDADQPAEYVGDAGEISTARM
ncbi:MAG: DUF4097 family beta strand repeat protein [Acidobacteria bacterium]|nr:DUF4097 family beta strand repeat protein [Acidobacteriota bacterium]